jgi:glycerol-3-phosphate dehydrogenase (NAD(P)+)
LVIKLETIGFIGAGALGGAIGKRLEAGYKVTYWDVNPALATAESLDDLAASSDLILICAPSGVNRLIAREIAQAVPEGPGPVVMSLAKGVEPNFATMDQVLQEELGTRFTTGVISGPMLAGEIAAGHNSGAVVAASDLETATAVAAVLGQAGLLTQTSTDPTGVARCGALKNVYALVLGLADGLKFSYNSKSILTALAIDELSRVLAHLGSDPSLSHSLAGLGDLLTTGWSGASFNWRVGLERGQGGGTAKGEGVKTLMALAEVIPIEQFNLAHAAWTVFNQNADPQILKAVLAPQR